MQIDVRGRGIVVPEEIVGEMEARLRSAVNCVQPPVRSLLVRIVDDNGPRGGEDKRCVVVASGSGAGSTVGITSSAVPPSEGETGWSFNGSAGAGGADAEAAGDSAEPGTTGGDADAAGAAGAADPTDATDAAGGG